MPEQDPQKLEAFVHRALRELPTHRAPASLEDRVFAALAARAHAPWWRRGWQAWPAAPRALVLGSGAAAAVVCVWLALAGGQVASAVQGGSWVQTHLPRLAALGSFCETLFKAFALLTRDLQPYLLPAAAVIGLSYIALIGLGTSLYRSLAPTR